jgi:hypothetical protein
VTRALALATLMVGVTGCGSEDDEADSGLGAPPTYPVPGCEAIDHRRCDIREERCQERLMELAACLRGNDPLPLPPVTLMTEEEFLAFLNQDIAENPPPDPNHLETALDLLDLVTPGALAPGAIVQMDVEKIWGIYRNEEKDVLVVDHGVPADEPEPNAVLLHEFVHALQDADVDLSRLRDEYVTSFDSYLGVASIVEGEARLHESRFWASLLGLDPGSIDWAERFQTLSEFSEEEVLSAPSPYLATFVHFPYELGARFVHYAWSESGPEGVDRLFASPPTRSHAIMASLQSIASADWPAPDFPALDVLEPYALWDETSLGAWGLYLRLERLTQPEAARSLALYWRGDHFGVYVSDGSPPQTIVAWRIELANESAALQIEALEGSAGAFFREGNRLVIVRGTDATIPDWALIP